MVKVCTKCRKEKYVEEFNEYWHSTFQKHYRRGYCKACESEAKKKYKMGVKALILNKTDFWGGTTDDYYAMPNEYVDEDQRLSVFRVMKLMGWKSSVDIYRDGLSDNVKIAVAKAYFDKGLTTARSMAQYFNIPVTSAHYLISDIKSTLKTIHNENKR